MANSFISKGVKAAYDAYYQAHDEQWRLLGARYKAQHIVSVSWDSIRVVLHPNNLEKSIEFEKIDQLLIILLKKTPNNIWKSIPQGETVKVLISKRSAGGLPAISTRLKNMVIMRLY